MKTMKNNWNLKNKKMKKIITNIDLPAQKVVIILPDKDNENPEEKPQKSEEVDSTKPRLELIKILTEEDWLLLNKLREEFEQVNEKTTGKKRRLADLQAAEVNEQVITGPHTKKQKLTSEERYKVIKDLKKEQNAERKENRKVKQSSFTNHEKQKGKNWMMKRDSYQKLKKAKKMISKRHTAKQFKGHMKKRRFRK